MLVAAPAALAQDATWRTTPASNDFNAPGNWTPGAVPGGLATFGASSITTLRFSASSRIDGFIFDPGAPGYTFDLSSGFSLRFQANGIINNSANAPTFNVSNSPLIFDDSSTAGNAIINLNAGSVQFLNTSTAGTAQLNAAAATTFDFTGTTGPANNGIFSAGSISGSGNFDLGVNNRLVVGSNDLSTTVSGTIVSGAITKVGAGTLTLSGSNTYAGGTTLSSGALMIGNSDALGSGDLSMAPGTTLAFDSAAAYTIANNISIAGDPIFDVGAGPAQTVSGIISDTDPVNNPGIVEKNGAGTLILSGANTYSGGTVINAGTLQVTNSTPGTSSSVGVGDVTLSGGTFQTDGSTNLTFGNNFKINTAGGAVDNNGTILTLSGIISNGNGSTGVLQLTDSIGLGTTVLSGVNTYSGGTKVIGATLQVNNNSSVGTGLVTLENGLFQVADTILTPTLSFSNNFAINNTLSGSAIDVNGYSLTISGNITDGNGQGKLTVLDSFGGGVLVLTGTNTYSGGTEICNCGTLQLGTIGTSGSILGAVTNKGTFDIVNANTSGITTVTNEIFAKTIFRNSTDAGTMTIDNQSGGAVEFRQISSAANATINNNIFARTTFFNSSTAGNATINNIAGMGFGVIEFTNLSTAGAATINNNSGEVTFIDRSNASTATINNSGFGALAFANRASADNATIVNSSAVGMDFFDQSTAGNAFITTNNNSGTFFSNRSDGGTARFETEAGSIVDFSGSRGPLADRKVHAGSIAGAGDYFIGSRNTLLVGGNNLSTEVSGVIADQCGCSPSGSPGGVLEKVGTGTLTLSGTNTYTGGTTITAGTLQLGNGTATTGSILGDVTDNATLAFNRPNAYQFDFVISGSGAVLQVGAGTTTLTAVNTYAGATTISAGTLALSGAGSIANSSGVIDNGTFDISATSAGASIKNLSGAGIVTLGSQTLTLTNASGTFAGATGGNGGLVKQGAGLFTLSGTNTYAGATTVAGGELRVNGSVASAVNVQSGATLSGIGNVGGLVTIQSGGTLSAGQSPGTLMLGALNLNAGSTSVFELGSAGVVGGASNDLVNVTGNLTLGGTLSVNAPSAGYYRLFNYGTLTASSFGAINGSSNGTPTVLTNVPNQVNLLIAGAGQRVQFWDGADQTGNGVVNGGTGTWNAANTNWTGAPGQAGINDQWRSSVGVFAGTAGTVTIAGTQAFDTLQFTTTGYVLNAGAGGQLQLAGLSGTGTVNTDNGVAATIGAPLVNGSSTSLTKVGGGTLILTGANTYSGGTVISGGTLQIGNGGTTGSIVGNVTDNGVFAINRSDAVTFNGVISGSGVVNQVGTGTTILINTNTYTGGTTISGGALQLGDAGSAGSIVGAVLNSGTFSIVNANTAGITTITNTGGSTTFYNSNSGGTAIITNNFQGVTQFKDSSTAGNSTIFNNSNAGGLFFGNFSSAGNATITNDINVTTQFSDNSTAGSATISNKGTPGQGIQGNIYFTGNSTGGNARIINDGTVSIEFLNSAGLSVGSIEGGGYFALGSKSLTVGSNNLSTEYSGLIGGESAGTGGSLTKVGNGTLTLTGSYLTSYTGGTTITAGTLQLGNGGTSGSIIGNVLNNATFAINRSDAMTFDGAISGTGVFQQKGVGTTSLTGANNYTGGTVISAGILQIGNGGTTGSIAGNVTDNSVLAFNRSNALTFDGVISGTGAVNQIGTGTTTLTADNNYGGGTIISAGTLQLGNGGTTGSIVGNVLNNSVLTINRSNALVLGGAISGSGAFNQIGSGTTTLSGANTYTGATTISNGTLVIAAGGSIASDATNNATFNNSGLVAGSVVNNAAFNNSASGIVSGLLTNTAATTTNFGQLNGGANVSGGTLTNNNQISGSVGISGAGTLNNNQTIAGAVTNAAVFNNNINGTVSGLLTNTAGTTINTGRLNGGASISGGALTTTGTILNGLTNTAIVNASGGAINGAIANNAGGAFNVLGTVTSDNIFTNAANAALAIGASGAYTLQGMLTNSGAVTVASGGQLIATVGGITNNSGGTIAVALGGTVKDDLNNAGAVINNGVYVANVASNTGTIDNNKTWTGTVSNAGAFNNNAGATVSGVLTNTAGTTVNNGALNGGASVSGGTFTGSGSVTSLTVSGGVFAPGNGTPGSSMTITGNLAFQSGALYLVQLNPATSTLANVTGTAALNGGAGAAFLAGNYVAKQYTILTAAGGVSGTFGSFDTFNIPSGFRASLSYDTNNVFLDLDLALAKYSGLNVNQQNVANALVNFFNTTGGIPAVFGTLTPGGLAQASGELATGTQQTTFNAMNLFLGLLTDPFVAGRSNGDAAPAGVAQFAEETEAAAAYAATAKPRTRSEREAYAAIYRKASIRDSYDPRWSVWAAGYGGSQTTDGNVVLGSNNTRSSLGAIAVGADYRFSPNTLAGFAVSGGGTSFSVANSGTGRSDLFQAGAFVRHNVGAAYLTGALAYGWQDVTTDRTVTIAGADVLRASFNSNTFSGRAEGGYRFVAPWIGGVGITPYAAGQFITIDLPAYAEQAIAGAGTFALSYASKSVTDTRSELGIRSDKSFAMQNGIFTLRGRAAWAHDFNPERNIAATFQTLPGASFVVNGATQASDSALVTGSAEMKWLNGFSLAATFEGEFSSVTRSYAGKGVARYTW